MLDFRKIGIYHFYFYILKSSPIKRIQFLVTYVRPYYGFYNYIYKLEIVLINSLSVQNIENKLGKKLQLIYV